VYKFVETGETIEVQQAFTDDALTEALNPRTGDVMAVKKVFTPVGVTFKGGGFYKTDSRGKSSSTKVPSSNGAGDSSSSSSSSDSGSSDSSSSTSSSSAATSPSTSSSSD
jgi:predicted nucleic acid-binding Zn ribbon protein